MNAQEALHLAQKSQKRIEDKQTKEAMQAIHNCASFGGTTAVFRRLERHVREHLSSLGYEVKEKEGNLVKVSWGPK